MNQSPNELAGKAVTPPHKLLMSPMKTAEAKRLGKAERGLAREEGHCERKDWIHIDSE